MEQVFIIKISSNSGISEGEISDALYNGLQRDELEWTEFDLKEEV